MLRDEIKKSSHILKELVPVWSVATTRMDEKVVFLSDILSLLDKTNLIELINEEIKYTQELFKYEAHMSYPNARYLHNNILAKLTKAKDRPMTLEDGATCAECDRPIKVEFEWIKEKGVWKAICLVCFEKYKLTLKEG